jgi:hypothetical protein
VELRWFGCCQFRRLVLTLQDLSIQLWVIILAYIQIWQSGKLTLAVPTEDVSEQDSAYRVALSIVLRWNSCKGTNELIKKISAETHEFVMPIDTHIEFRNLWGFPLKRGEYWSFSNLKAAIVNWYYKAET